MKQFAEDVSVSNLRHLDITGRCLDGPSLSVFLQNLHSTSLRSLDIFCESRSSAETAAEQEDEDAAREEAMDTAISVSTFLRVSARTRLLLHLPGLRATDWTRQPHGGCPALQSMTCLGDSTPGAEDLIHGLWRVTHKSFDKHPDPTLSKLFHPQLLNVILETESESQAGVIPTRSPTTKDVRSVFGGTLHMGSVGEVSPRGERAYLRWLSDPTVARLVKGTDTRAHENAFFDLLSGPRPASTWQYQLVDHNVDWEEHCLASPEGQAFRSAALQLLTAARILSCRVRSAAERMPSAHGEAPCRWLSLPVEIRRACLEQVPTLYEVEKADLGWVISARTTEPSEAYWENYQRRSPLSNTVVERILSFAADRRTIGYGRLPEAAFLDLRLASDLLEDDERGRTASNVIQAAPWSFAEAALRWRPVDCRTRDDADSMSNHDNDLSWEAEVFLRAIGLPEDLIDLLPAIDEVQVLDD